MKPGRDAGDPCGRLIRGPVDTRCEGTLVRQGGGTTRSLRAYAVVACPECGRMTRRTLPDPPTIPLFEVES